MSKADYDKVMNIDPKKFGGSIVSDLQKQAMQDAEKIKHEFNAASKSGKKKKRKKKAPNPSNTDKPEIVEVSARSMKSEPWWKRLW